MSLLVGGIGLLAGADSGPRAWSVPLALRALAYTALNSLNWVLADRSRFAYGVPITIGLVGAVASAIGLMAGLVMNAPG